MFKAESRVIRNAICFKSQQRTMLSYSTLAWMGRIWPIQQQHHFLLQVAGYEKTQNTAQNTVGQASQMKAVVVKSRCWLMLLLVFLPWGQVLADADLYQGRAVVADQSTAEQATGMRAALQQVLGKLTGLNQFDDYPGVSSALSSASKIVLAFYYENRPLTLPDGTKVEEFLLVANFSPKAVDQLRTELQLPRWKPERQPLTIWPIVDNGQGRNIMPIELEYAWMGLADLANDRAMPLRWPEADENGEFPADVQLLWGGYAEGLGKEPAEAGGPTETLVVAALHDGPEWNVRMNLDYEGLRWSERFRGVDLETVLGQGLNLAIDQIVAASSIAATESGDWQVDITVTDLSNADDYARCLTYLQELSVVEIVLVKSASAGRVSLSLALNAAPEYLQQYLSSGKTLTPSAVEGEYQLSP